MTPTEAFQRARDALLRNAGDLERARAEFTWPVLGEFNWACDWFDELARGNPSPALVRVGEPSGVTTVSYATLSERSTRLARWLSDHGVARGDRILVMLTNVVPLWETMLAVISSPRTTSTIASCAATCAT
jgi:acetyl-CoA synthetase